MNSTNQDSTQSETAATDAKSKQLGPGRKLKLAREANGLSIKQVAEKLKLTETLVKEIEHDNYQHAPNKVFIRGYLRSYAKLLRLSGDELISLFDSLDIHDKKAEVTASFDLPQIHKGHDKIVVWATAIVIIGVFLLVFLWWRGQRNWPQFSHVTTSLISQNSATDVKANTQMNDKQVMQTVFPPRIGATLDSQPMVVKQQNMPARSDNNLQLEQKAATANSPSQASTGVSNSDAAFVGDSSQSASTGDTASTNQNSSSVRLSPPF